MTKESFFLHEMDWHIIIIEKANILVSIATTEVEHRDGLCLLGSLYVLEG